MGIGKNKQKKSYFKWVFSNKWYYLLPLLWVVFGAVIVYLQTGNLSSYVFPKGSEISYLSLFISLVVYYLIWLIPFFIYWLISRRKKRKN